VRKRIVALTLLAAMVAISLFGVPLALAAARYYLADERAELERVADSAALMVAADTVRQELPDQLPPTEPMTGVALYNPEGVRLLGDGPDRLDSATVAIEPGQVLSADTSTDVVLAVAISDRGRVTGIVRAATPYREIQLRTGLTWLGMVVLGGLALVTTWLIAHHQARRLAHPLEELSDTARRLGSGDFTVRTRRTGVPEIDSVSTSLEITAQRLDELLARERAFSADASHQLRTPLAGLRLQLEAALDTPEADLREAITAGIGTSDRLERTIDDLLALARDIRPANHSAVLGEQLAEIEHDWHGPLAEQGRALRITVSPDISACRVAAPVLRQIMAVLLDNATRHGRGMVTVIARDAGAAVAIDVSDEGAGIHPGPDLFHRRVADTGGHGIGLALARRLAEAEGGRLQLSRPAPPTFTLLLLPSHR
jgi:signal transduction histidine kinase